MSSIKRTRKNFLKSAGIILGALAAFRILPKGILSKLPERSKLKVEINPNAVKREKRI